METTKAGIVTGDVEMTELDEELKTAPSERAQEEQEQEGEDNVPTQFAPTRGPSSMTQRFVATMNFRYTLKKRKFKYNSGAFAQWGLGLMINFVLLLLCMVIRKRLGDPYEVPQRVSILDNGGINWPVLA